MENVVIIHSPEECVEKLSFLNKNTSQFERVRNNGMKLVKERWNYRYLLPKFLSEIRQS